MPRNTVKALIQRIKPVDPVLYDALSQMAEKINALDKSVDEVRSEISTIPITGLAIASNVTIFTYQISRRYVKLLWEQPDDSIRSYELRHGANWETGSRILTTGTTSAVLDPLLKGSHTYHIKGIDVFGNYSSDPASLTFNIYGPGTVTMTTQVFGSNVLLYWLEPITEFDIVYYAIYKDGTLLGQFTGTFANLLELNGGTINYTIHAVDVATNIGTDNTITVKVAPPIDFELQSERLSTYSGTKVNCLVDTINNRLIAPIDIASTWDQHFSTRSWTSPQSQITAGYPIYIQPGTTTASYTEVIDFGVVFNDTLISIAYLSNILYGSVAITIQMEFSTDNLTWTAPVVGLTIYVQTMRYVRVKVLFTGANDQGLIEFYKFKVSVNVHRELDSGFDTAFAVDASGTEFLFKKAFKDVDSITLTVDTTKPVIAIYDFDDIPNPHSFFVKVYDAAGVRMTYPVSWKARGIV